MIFYFSGTGNSYAAAKQIAGEDELLIDIGECVREKRFSFQVKEDEKFGIVCPVYFWGIPSIVIHFLSRIDLEIHPLSYCFAVLTCGGSIGGADHMLEEHLNEASITLDAVYSVIMPDNYVLMYDVMSEEKQEQVLAEAGAKLDTIREAIDKKTIVEERSGRNSQIKTSLLYPLYVRGRKTDKFWVDDRCVGCGLCAQRCANQAIKIVDGKPTWVKKRCIHCLGCMNRCGAIQYGKKTEKRGRYVNPVWRKKKECNHND